MSVGATLEPMAVNALDLIFGQKRVSGSSVERSHIYISMAERVPRGETYTFLGPDGQAYHSATPGTRGGHKRRRIYGRLDCPSALRAIARGGYVKYRVFFAYEQDAISAGYRLCAVCLPERYAQ